MMSGNYLESSLSGLVEVYGWEKVVTAVEEILKREVRVKKICLYTNKPLAHLKVCDYCRHTKCPLAGGRS